MRGRVEELEAVDEEALLLAEAEVSGPLSEAGCPAPAPASKTEPRSPSTTVDFIIVLDRTL